MRRLAWTVIVLVIAVLSLSLSAFAHPSVASAAAGTSLTDRRAMSVEWNQGQVFNSPSRAEVRAQRLHAEAPINLDAADQLERDLTGRFAAEAGAFGARSLDELSAAAGAPGKGDLTIAGLQLTKHAGGQRAGSSAFPVLRGNASEINRMAQWQVDDILTSPGSRFSTRHHARFGEVSEVYTPDGRGIRFGSDGRFIGFLEPRR